MKVAIAIPAFLPAVDYGGPVQKVLRLQPALAARGVQLSVLTSTLARLGDASLPPGPDTVCGIPILRLPTPVSHRFSPWVRFTGVGHYDVMHVIGAWNGLSYAALALGRRHARVVLWEPVGMLAVAGRHTRIKRALSPLHRQLMARCDGVIWTSERERQEAPPTDGCTAYFRANPCEPFDADALPSKADARRALGLPVDGRLWGYLGRIDLRKGVDRLLRCWPGPQAGHLVIAGPAGDEALVAEIVARHADAILLHPALSAEARWIYLRALDALLLAPDFGENFGNVVIEAMQVGTPVVASPAVGALDWIDDPGVLRVAGDAALRRTLDGGTIPPPPRGLPASCTAPSVGAVQREIYDQALRRCSHAERT